ncbi:hypothetical protein [Streptomyces sp. gb14]|uniref:hypothetical protein n=1 Tax=Streptomyces sp. gb14 TaxID=1827753 RepID=UPI00211D58D6|nr:hypothetical protein [Streptomyces sp. gb14]
MSTAPLSESAIAAQRAWHATYRALAVPRPRHAGGLRCRLLHLSVRIHWHPWWSPPAGWSPTTRVEVCRMTALDR